MRWLIVAIAGIASAGLMAVGVSMNFAFGSSFGRTALESYAYGAAFGFADILKVAAPIVVARSLGNRNWGAAFSACSCGEPSPSVRPYLLLALPRPTEPSPSTPERFRRP